MTAETLQFWVFGLFVVLLAIGTFTTVGRTVYKLVNGIPIPRILIRDTFTMAGLTLPFLLIFAVRAIDPNLREVLKDNPTWIIITSIPAILALLVYDYFEIFVIGPPTKATHSENPNEYKKVD